MRHLEQILSCCSALAIVSISVVGIAKATEPLSMGPLRVSQVNPRYFTLYSISTPDIALALKCLCRQLVTFDNDELAIHKEVGHVF